jgi:hypothetical protein
MAPVPALRNGIACITNAQGTTSLDTDVRRDGCGALALLIVAGIMLVLGAFGLAPAIVIEIIRSGRSGAPELHGVWDLMGLAGSIFLFASIILVSIGGNRLFGPRGFRLLMVLFIAAGVCMVILFAATCAAL